ncbi:MAG: ABC transporter ATP-binding protein [Gemmatimonadales bacterium]|nr:MAG: ABC transporter ATP-binding protein [Gemmatimonadales bacterium]
MKHLRTLLPYFRPYRAGLVVGLVLVVVSNVFTVAAPWLLRLAIDALGEPEVSRGRILTYAGLIVVAAILGGAAKFGMRQLLNGISRRIECDLRDTFFRHLLRLDAPFYGSWRTGDIMSRATNDTLAVRQAAGPAVMYMVNTTVISIFALTLMVWISPRLTMLAVIPMVLLPPVVLGFGRVIHRRFERIQEQFSALSTLVQENLTGVRLVRAYVQERDQAVRFGTMNREYLERNLHLVRAQGLFHPILSLLTGVAMVIVLWVGGGEVMRGAITVGDFVAFTFYLNLLTWPLIALGWVVNLFQRGEASMGRINAVLLTEPAIRPGAGRTVGMDQARGGIEFRGVGFRYPGTERQVLRDLSFRVEPGETVAIVGPTGAGKSTLVSLLPRIQDPSTGIILLDGVPLTEYDPAEIRRRVGMVPQDTFLFSDTIEANVGLGLELDPPDAAVDPRVTRAARIAQLHEQIGDLPHGYRTRLGERGINLSGGQKQRATLARALARDPMILILDDALSAVDTHTEARILEELRADLAGRTAFIISHRVSAVMHADRILVLEGGALVETGTHAELLARGGTYAALLRRQLLEQEVEGEGLRSAPAGSPG